MPNPVTILNVTYPSQAKACAGLQVKPKDVCAYAAYHKVPWERALLHVFRRHAKPKPRPDPPPSEPSQAKIPWSHRDEAVMATYYPSEGITVKARLSRPRGDRAIMLKAQKMGLVKPMGRQAWTPEDEAVLREYYPAFGPDRCAVMLHRTLSAVSNKAAMLHLVHSTPDRPYHFMRAYASADGTDFFWFYCGLRGVLALLTSKQVAAYIADPDPALLARHAVPDFVRVPKSVQQAIRRLRHRLAGNGSIQA